jgi:phosphatidylethanolamine/phosphatidyl-N-methylethanolamine N-methyltransferase
MTQRTTQAVAGRQAGGLTSAFVRSVYDRWAPIYDAVFWGPTFWGRKMVVDRINALRGQVLEVGVGTGMALPLYGPGVELTGIDISPEMMQRTDERVRKNRLDSVRGLAVMDAGTMAFPDGAFDATVAMYVITAVPDPDKALDEMVRVTRLGGTVILVNHFRSDRGGWAPIERAAEPFTVRLGWDAAMPVERVLGRRDLTLVEQRDVPPLGLYTLLRFERRAA